MDHRISPAEQTKPGAARSTLWRSVYLLPLALASLCVLAGIALAAAATAAGPGVGGDATIYLTAAWNFYAGQGLGWVEADGSFRLLPYTPPFYPLVVGAAGWLAGDLLVAARWLNALLLGATALLAGWTAWRVTGRHWLAALVCGLAALSPVIFNVHLWAMSEPLFLFLSTASLYLLWAYLDRPRRSALLGAAVLAGLAFLTRYIGLAVILTGGLALLLLGEGAAQPGGWRRFLRWAAWREAVWFGVVAALPMLAWLAVGLLFTGTLASRSVQPAAAYWQRFLEIGPALHKIFLFWLLPDSLSSRLPGLAQHGLWLIPLLGLAALAWFSRTPARSAEPASGGAGRLMWVYGLYTFFYLLVLAGVQVFTYPPVTLASRMLSPVHLAALVLLPVFLWQARASLLPGSRLALALLALVGLFFLGSYGLRSAMIARDYNEIGIGYNALEWRDSATVARLAALPPGILIITNEATAVMFFTGRPAYVVQEIYQQQPSPVFSVYGDGDDPAQRAFSEQGGALVLFYNTLRDDFAMYGEQVDERLAALTGGLYPYYQGEDGAIYFLERPNLPEGLCSSCREDRYR